MFALVAFDILWHICSRGCIEPAKYDAQESAERSSYRALPEYHVTVHITSALPIILAISIPIVDIIFAILTMPVLDADSRHSWN